MSLFSISRHCVREGDCFPLLKSEWETLTHKNWQNSLNFLHLLHAVLFLCVLIYVLQLRLYDQFSNYLLFQEAKEEGDRRQGGKLNDN